MEFQNNTAIVTGAASGMGAATAAALSAAGAKVALFDINEELLKETANQVGGLAVACDVSDAAGTEQAFAAVKEQLGSVRILVNCAAVGDMAPVVGPEGPMPLEQFNRVVAINLGGTFNTIRLAAAEMIQLEPLADGSRGVIINTSSIAATDPTEYTSAYTASKGGIHSLTLGLAREFGDVGIRVMGISPAGVRTPMMENTPPMVQQAIMKTMPFPKKFAEASEFAKLVMHICDNTFLNGTMIRFDASSRASYKALG